MNDFMKGRNGAAELTIVMGFAGIVIAMIGSIARLQWLSWIAIAVIVIGVLRGLSKNIDARRKENEAFVAATANVPGLGKFVASLGGGAAAANASRAAGTSKEDFERAKRTAKKMWKGRKTTAYLKCQLRPDAFRSQGQGQDSRHLPQVPRQGGDALLAAIPWDK